MAATELAGDGGARQGRLRILASSDLHARIWPHDYDTDAQTSGQGLARLGTVIETARSETEASILLDNGDLLQGTQLADDLARQPDVPHPMFKAMNALGYDAATVGNHDFNFGLDFLEHRLAEADFPYVCGNIVRHRGDAPSMDQPFLPPFVMIERQIRLGSGSAASIKIAVVGAATPQILTWDKDLIGGRLAARGIVEAVSHWSAQARSEGADIVVALCHTGVGTTQPEDMAEDAALGVAALPSVDVVICGHSHRRLPGPDFAGADGVSAHLGRLAGKPAVMPGAFGSDLGVIDLDLAHGEGRWRILSAHCALRPVAETAPSKPILAETRGLHLKTRRASRRSLARLSGPLCGLFPLSGHADSLQIMADAQFWKARSLPEMQSSDLPLLSAVAPFRAGGTGGATGFTYVPAGPLRRGHLAEIAPFPNALTVIEVDGETLKIWLERGAAGYRQIAEGDRDVPLLSPDAASYNFETIFGVTYEIDVARPGWFANDGSALDQREDTRRISDLRHNGRLVQPDDRFAVVTNTYRAGGGGRFPRLGECPRIATARETLRETLAAYIAVADKLPGRATPVWRFAPVEATATVLSANWASDDHSARQFHRLEKLGQDSSGQSLFRLHLGQQAA